MYHKKKRFDPTEPPARWLGCPRKANQIIVDKFMAFKVPLCSNFDKNVPIACRFNMAMLIEPFRRNNYNGKLGLVIDLTNTDRFYDVNTEVKQQGIKHYKMNCKGHGETPTPDTTKLFISIVDNFIRQHPTEIIGVHCTHGFNRTGFLICAYLVEKLDFSIDMAVALFAQCRPPGIYKQDYINELFKRYADEFNNEVAIAPPTPNWEEPAAQPENFPQSSHTSNLDDDFSDDDACPEDDDEPDPFINLLETSNQPGQNAGADTSGTSDDLKRTRGVKRGRNERTKLNPVFCEPSIMGVEACTDPDEVSRVQTVCQMIIGWKGKNFPGAQPVSMDMRNVNNLRTHKYMVSWKADGTRYLMVVLGRGKVYMIDRENCVFCVRNLQFPHRKDLDKHLSNTLMDGEFVMDVDPNSGQKIPRFLIYDIMKFENDDVGKISFQVRLQCINKEIIFARDEAFRQGKLNKQIEPFSIRQKLFYKLSDTKKLLSPDFEKQITHGIDGLIYQPVDLPYTGGRSDQIFKWKPSTMNSVDFRLIIKKIEEPGLLTERIGELYVNGYDQPYAYIKVTKTIGGMHNKIIECRWHEDKWDFMRERIDKTTPNHITTAIAVCESIRNPVTEQFLINLIIDVEEHQRRQQQQFMPPPQQPPPPHF